MAAPSIGCFVCGSGFSADSAWNLCSGCHLVAIHKDCEERGTSEEAIHVKKCADCSARGPGTVVTPEALLLQLARLLFDTRLKLFDAIEQVNVRTNIGTTSNKGKKNKRDTTLTKPGKCAKQSAKDSVKVLDSNVSKVSKLPANCTAPRKLPTTPLDGVNGGETEDMEICLPHVSVDGAAGAASLTAISIACPAGRADDVTLEMHKETDDSKANSAERSNNNIKSSSGGGGGAKPSKRKKAKERSSGTTAPAESGAIEMRFAEKDENNVPQRQSEEDKEKGFIPVTYKRRTANRLRAGCAAEENSDLKVCKVFAKINKPIIKALRVEGLVADTSAMDLRSWLADKDVKVDAIFKLHTKGRWAVFCVVPESKDFVRCSKEDFWMKGVYFRRWNGAAPFEKMVMQSFVAKNGPHPSK